MWVLFLSVIGAALFTLSVIVKEIREPANFNAQKDLRQRLQKIVQQQFFILFSLLGGIFLNQTLVLADAVSEPVTVGIAALGAGASLNVILARAVSASEKWLSAPPKSKSQSENEANQPRETDREKTS